MEEKVQSRLMKKIEYGFLNFDNEAELKAAALAHESAPLNWDSSYLVTDDRVKMWLEVFLKIKDRGDAFLYVARNETKKIVGFHWVNIEKKDEQKCARIDSLWVDETCRKQGVGSRLKLEGEKWAKDQGAAYLRTGVFYNNQRMIDFNLKMGFKPQQVEMIKLL